MLPVCNWSCCQTLGWLYSVFISIIYILTSINTQNFKKLVDVVIFSKQIDVLKILLNHNFIFCSNNNHYKTTKSKSGDNFVSMILIREQSKITCLIIMLY